VGCDSGCVIDSAGAQEGAAFNSPNVAPVASQAGQPVPIMSPVNVREFDEDNGFDTAVALEGLAPPSWTARDLPPHVVVDEGPGDSIDLGKGQRPAEAATVH
jgi:hypothetical protein